MAYQDAQQTLYDALKSRGIDKEAEEGKEKYLRLDSTLPIHGSETPAIPLTTQRVRIIFRGLAKEHNLSGLNLTGINEARTFSQLTSILANTTPRSTDEDLQHEMALAYADIPIRPWEVPA